MYQNLMVPESRFVGSESCLKGELPMKSESRWRGWLLNARSGYVLREIAGEYLLIPVELEDGSQSQMAVLNEVGAFLWELMKEPQTVDTMAKAITGEYEISREEAEADICEFLDHLAQHQLLTKTEVRK